MIEIIVIQTIAGAVVVASVGIAAALAWKVSYRRETSAAQTAPRTVSDGGGDMR